MFNNLCARANVAVQCFVWLWLLYGLLIAVLDFVSERSGPYYFHFFVLFVLAMGFLWTSYIIYGLIAGHAKSVQNAVIWNIGLAVLFCGMPVILWAVASNAGDYHQGITFWQALSVSYKWVMLGSVFILLSICLHRKK